MNTDHELLELAAKAAGYQIDERQTHWTWADSELIALLNLQGGHTLWNSLDNDGDALRLAVKLGIPLHTYPDHHQGAQVVAVPPRLREVREYAENNADDLDAATRRAITRAAAEIGKAMP